MGAPHVWLRSAIESASGVTAWPVEMTGSVSPPYVVYMRENTTRQLVLADALDDTPSPDQLGPVARFSLVIYCDSYVQAWTIAKSIADAIHRFTGTVDGTTIAYCLVADERDGMSGYLDGREQPTYTVEQTVEISWEE
jgi:hypothetical protein